MASFRARTARHHCDYQFTCCVIRLQMKIRNINLETKSNTNNKKYVDTLVINKKQKQKQLKMRHLAE